VKVIVVGAGNLGQELALELAGARRHDVVLIDADASVCKAAAAHLDALVLHGDGTDPAVLAEAGLARADALVAVTGSDAINTVVAILGRRAGVGRVIVKLDHLGLRPACDEIGVDAVIAPTLAAAAHIVSALHGTDRLDFSVVSRGGLRLVELEAGKGLTATLSELGVPDGVLVVAVLRGDQVLMPRGRTAIAGGDVLLTLVESPAALAAFREVIASPSNDRGAP